MFLAAKSMLLESNTFSKTVIFKKIAKLSYDIGKLCRFFFDNLLLLKKIGFTNKGFFDKNRT